MHVHSILSPREESQKLQLPIYVLKTDFNIESHQESKFLYCFQSLWQYYKLRSGFFIQHVSNILYIKFGIQMTNLVNLKKSARMLLNKCRHSPIHSTLCALLFSFLWFLFSDNFHISQLTFYDKCKLSFEFDFEQWIEVWNLLFCGLNTAFCLINKSQKVVAIFVVHRSGYLFVSSRVTASFWHFVWCHPSPCFMYRHSVLCSFHFFVRGGRLRRWYFF